MPFIFAGMFVGIELGTRATRYAKSALIRVVLTVVLYTAAAGVILKELDESVIGLSLVMTLTGGLAVWVIGMAVRGMYKEWREKRA